LQPYCLAKVNALQQFIMASNSRDSKVEVSQTG